MSLEKENRVLVVDDEEALLEAVSQVLKRGGYAIATAASGEEAWELFLSNPYPVVVTDLDMKNMSGKSPVRTSNRLTSWINTT